MSGLGAARRLSNSAHTGTPPGPGCLTDTIAGTTASSRALSWGESSQALSSQVAPPSMRRAENSPNLSSSGMDPAGAASPQRYARQRANQTSYVTTGARQRFCCVVRCRQAGQQCHSRRSGTPTGGRHRRHRDGHAKQLRGRTVSPELGDVGQGPWQRRHQLRAQLRAQPRWGAAATHQRHQGAGLQRRPPQHIPVSGALRALAAADLVLL